MWKNGHSEQAKTWVDISTVVPIQNTEDIGACLVFPVSFAALLVEALVSSLHFWVSHVVKQSYL